MAELIEGTQVELRPGYEEVYPRAWAASRGTVGDTRTDPDGFEQVYIVWDKKHWRYNGEKDGWTFAEHFRPIDGSDNREIIPVKQTTVPALPPPLEEDEEERTEHYLDILMAACDKAAESEGFFMITLKQDDMNDGIRLEVLGATTNEDLDNLPTDTLFRYVEQEMRRRRTQE